MDMMAITSGIGALKNLKDLAAGLATLKTQGEINAAVQGIQSQIIEVQQALMNAQGQLIQLRHELDESEHKRQMSEKWDGLYAEYALWITPEGGTVLRHREDERLTACPSCADTKHEIHHLQPTNTMAEKLVCPNCKFGFPYRNHF